MKNEEIPPHHQTFIDVGDGHELYVERWGTVGAHPVIFVHGGPGAGFSPRDRNFFDPQLHDAIFWDQRGAGKSRFEDRLRENHTTALLHDLERVQEYFAIPRVSIFAGSWGSTLALLYAAEHPSRVISLLLRGLFLADKQALDYMLSGPRTAYPKLFERFVSNVHEKTKIQEIARQYVEGMTSKDEKTRATFVSEWARFELLIGARTPNEEAIDALLKTTDFTPFSLISSSYIAHNFFLDGRSVQPVPEMPMTVIHGRHDAVASFERAEEFVRGCPHASLYGTEGGHSAFEPDTFSTLVREAKEMTTKT